MMWGVVRPGMLVRPRKVIWLFARYTPNMGNTNDFIVEPPILETMLGLIVAVASETDGIDACLVAFAHGVGWCYSDVLTLVNDRPIR